ncbi:MAG: cytochrome c family protein, partial [Proteobacteria bacterium]|nr:cytochrome c family protein [Pseudomonadota bacterium]
MEYHALINNLIRGFLLIASCCVTSVVAADTKQPDYVGMQVCRTCHAAQVNKWIGSPHDLAMQDATVKSVLGNFNNARFQKNGVNTTFYRKGDRFMVRTDG